MAKFNRTRRVLFSGALFVAVVLCLILVRSHLSRAVVIPVAYSLPQVVDTNPDPDIVETTLIAEWSDVDIGNGVQARVQTYNGTMVPFNGTIPSPTFRLKVGDTVIVHFVNHLNEGTGIHWHGIELANASDGTPLTQNAVPQNGTFLYKFKVTRPGIFWYHPHHKYSTNQVFHGLYGLIIVTDPNEASLISNGVIPGPAQTVPLVLSDITVCKDNNDGNDTRTYDLSLPWVGGSPLPLQHGPTPDDLCAVHPLNNNGTPAQPTDIDNGYFAYLETDVPYIQPAGNKGTVVEGQTVLTDGLNVGSRAGSPDAPGALATGASSLDVQAGQGLRLQIADTATTRYFNLHLTDSNGTAIPLFRIGGEGGLLDHAVVEGGVVNGFNFHYPSGQILLAPGDRADVVVAIPSTEPIGSVLTLWTEDFPRHGGGQYSDIPTVPVMHLSVTGTASSAYTISPGTPLREATGVVVEALGPPTFTLLDPATFNSPMPGMANQDIRLTNNNPATGFSGMLGINSVQGFHDVTGDYTAIPHMGSARYAQVGDTLELTVTNVTGADHPFHLHGFSIQPISLTDTMPCGPQETCAPDMEPGNDASPGTGPTYIFPYHEFMDNIDVPGGYTLTFRVRLDDRPQMDGTTSGGALGRWFFHCHIFFHAAFGMISELDVLDRKVVRPNISVDVGSLTANLRDQLFMTGTYQDPGGETLTLSASEGTIVDNHDGTWVWNAVATGSSRIVYVTATDTDGSKNQTAFALDVIFPDLVVTAVTPNASTVNYGGTLSVDDTVKNLGPGVSSGSFRIGYYLSLDPAGATHDVDISTIRALTTTFAVNETNSATTDLSVPSTAPGGAYYLCAVADSVNQINETDETNNTLCSGTVTLPKADLRMTAVSSATTVIAPGKTLSVSNSVTNQGGYGAGSFRIGFYLSVNPDGSSQDVAITATRTLSALAAGASSTGSTNPAIPSTTRPNSYYLCVMADSLNQIPESDEGNNTLCTASAIQVTLPDLTMTAVTSNASHASPGGPLSVPTTVSNGGAASGGFRIGFRLSPTASYDDPGAVVITTTRVVNSLAAEASSPDTTSLTLPGSTPSGDYYVCTLADSLSQVTETNETNNTLCSTATVTVP
jgi:FtsP/CotA-like multicopper oxidase with cupredoxin domain